MSTLNDAKTYFKSNEGYTRLFNKIKQKYVSYGEIKGNVIINDPTLSEKQILSGLMKKDFSINSAITINIKKLQQRIDESKFSGVELEDLLKASLSNACKGINNLPKVKSDNHKEPSPIRIPVFASNITLNSHAYDKNSVCGNLFIILLCYINKAPYPQNSEELAELYYNNYLLVDDVSNMVKHYSDY